MVTINKIPLLLLLAVAGISSAMAEDYSEHPIVIRMRELQNLIRAIKMGDTKFEIVKMFNAEVSRHNPNLDPSHGEDTNVGESLIALLKLFALIENHSEEFSGSCPLSKYLYTETLKNILRNSIVDLGQEIRNNQRLAEYVLDWNSFVDLLNSLDTKNNRLNEEMEWISYALMLFIKNTSYLKQSFLQRMMFRLNKARNKANAINMIYSTNNLQSNDILLEQMIRFPFADIMINLNLSMEPILELQMKRTLLNDELKNAIYVYNYYDDVWNQERAITSALLALLELTDSELLDHLDEVTLGLWFNEILKTNVVSKLVGILKERCKNPIFQNSDLPKRQLIARRLFESYLNVMDQPAVIDSDSVEYYKMLNKIIVKEFLQLDRNGDKYESLLKVYYEIGDILAKPEVLNDSNQFAKYDRYHKQLFESNEYALYKQREWMKSILYHEKLKTNLNQANELMKSIDPQNLENSVDTRNKIRILLRLSLQMCNLFQYDFDGFEESTKTAVKMYIKLMKYGSNIFTDDLQVMKEWFFLTLTYPTIVSNVLDDETINDIAHYHKKEMTQNGKSADIVLYLFLTSIARNLAIKNHPSKANELIPAILDLEQRIGFADFAPLSVQQYVVKEKEMFYIYYATQAIPFQTNLTSLVEHHVELLTFVRNWLDLRYPLVPLRTELRVLARRQLLDAIYTATANDPNAANNLIDSNGELRFKVNQLMNGFNREFGMDDDLAEKVSKCEAIYGPIDA